MIIKNILASHKMNCLCFVIMFVTFINTSLLFAQNPTNYAPDPVPNSRNSNIVDAPLEITWHFIVGDMELGKQSGWQLNIPYVQLNSVTKHWMNYLKELNHLVRKKRSRQGNYFFSPDLPLPSDYNERANVYTYFDPYLGGVSLKAFFNIDGEFVDGNSAPTHLQEAIERFLMDFAVGEYAEAVKAVIAAEGMNLMELQIANNQLAIQLRERTQQMDKHRAMLRDLEKFYQEDLALQADNTQVINQKIAAIEWLQNNLGQYGEQVSLTAKDYLDQNDRTTQQPYLPQSPPTSTFTPKNPVVDNKTNPPKTYPEQRADQNIQPNVSPPPTANIPPPQKEIVPPNETKIKNYPPTKSNLGWNQNQQPTKQNWRKNTDLPSKTTTYPPPPPNQQDTSPNIGQPPPVSTNPQANTTPNTSPNRKNWGKNKEETTSNRPSNQPKSNTTTENTGSTSYLLNAQGQAVDYLTPRERIMIEEINLLRANPKGYVVFVKEYLQQLNHPNSKIGELVNKGRERNAGQEVITELNQLLPLPLFIPHQGVYNAVKNHGLDLKQSGQIGHQGSDGSQPDERIKIAAPEMKAGSENIVTDLQSVRTTVVYLLIDGNTANRRHRKNLLADYWTHIGVYQVPDKIGNTPYCWVQGFSSHSNVAITTAPIASTENRNTPPTTPPSEWSNNGSSSNRDSNSSWGTQESNNTPKTYTTTPQNRTDPTPPPVNWGTQESNNPPKTYTTTPQNRIDPTPPPVNFVAGSEFLNAQGRSVDYLLPAEKVMIQEINFFRSNPKTYIPYIQQYIAQLDDLNSEVGSLSNKTEERNLAYELIAKLERMLPLPLLIPHRGVYAAAKRHGLDVKQQDEAGYRGSDGSYPSERIQQEASDMAGGSENIIAGINDIRTALIYLLIDNGTSNRGHRKNLLAANWTHIGVYRIDGELGGIPYGWIQSFGKQLTHITAPPPPPISSKRISPPVAKKPTTFNTNTWQPANTNPINNPRATVPQQPNTTIINNTDPVNHLTTIKADANWLFLDETMTQPTHTPRGTPLETPTFNNNTIPNNNPSNNGSNWGKKGLPSSDYRKQNAPPNSSNKPTRGKIYPWLRNK